MTVARRAAGVARPGPSVEVERAAWAVLSSANGLGPVGFARLIRTHGSATALLDLARRPDGTTRLIRAGLAIDGDEPDRAPSWRALDPEVAAAVVATAQLAERILLGIRKLGLDVMTLEDADYPPRLLALEMPPPVLFIRGDRGVLQADRAVAVVGTRRATEAGRWVATLIADAISKAGGVVVSGLAMGIDGAAHSAAVAADRPTVAVLGSGHGRLYPKAHVNLAERIVDRGGTVISELSPDVPGNHGTFPRRNRVISGLSAATVVVEAPARSGALITAEWALEQGRECFVVPGPFGAASAAGALEFLRTYHGQARIVSTITGLLEDLGFFDARRSQVEAASIGLGSVEGRLATLVAGGVATVDALVGQTGLPVATVLSALTLLEMRGLVAAAYGRYRPHGLLMPSIGPRNQARPTAQPKRLTPTATGA